MRVSIERPHKKPIIMRIRSLMRIRSSSLDQEADAVWVMSLNFVHLFVMRIRIYNVYSRACAKPQEFPSCTCEPTIFKLCFELEISHNFKHGA